LNAARASALTPRLRRSILLPAMIPHAPSDATFASLVVGVSIGLTFAFGTYIALTQSWLQQFAALLSFLHTYGVATWLGVAIATTIYVRIGWMTLKQEVKLKAEVS
jgi:hypothetical protein